MGEGKGGSRRRRRGEEGDTEEEGEGVRLHRPTLEVWPADETDGENFP